MSFQAVVCPECGHENERFVSEDVCLRAERRGMPGDAEDLTYCGKNERGGCGRTLLYRYSPTERKMHVKVLPTNDAFVEEPPSL